MAVKETGFRWICDWCGLHKTTAAGDRSIPEGWIPVEGGALYKFELDHLCSDACWQKARVADGLAHEMSKHVVRMIRRYCEGMSLEEIPDSPHVELRLVVDEVEVEVEVE